MSSTDNSRKIFSLAEVANSIRKTLLERYGSAVWIKAEMNKLNLHPHTGHCYPELVEKVEGRVVAQLRSCLWNDAYLRCDRNFRRVLKEPLRDGIKILFLGKVTFHAIYGLQIDIMDIDPSFTLGDLEREKQETLQRLEEENILNRNKALPYPTLPKRVAIISVETSKGYADFQEVIQNNPWGYKFFTMLFPALLQGERAVTSIMYQLKRILKVYTHFDVVAIIRGGGGDVGLSSYNDYQLARAIATFPIPVITGIGHATNETVAEMVSALNAITPTKLADHLLQRFHDFARPVDAAERSIHDRAMQMLTSANQQMKTELKLFRSACLKSMLQREHELFQEYRGLMETTRKCCNREEHALGQIISLVKKDIRLQLRNSSDQVSSAQDELTASVQRGFSSYRGSLAALERDVRNLSPENVLKRGYSIARLNGKAITDAKEVREGDHVTIELLAGKIDTIVQK